MLLMADVELTSVDWLWFPYIHFGKLTIIQGNTGEGKTLSLIHIFNAMEISLKKVLGYRFYEMHKRFISVNLLENIAVVILICIVSLFISNASVGIALLVGALLTIIEMAIIFTNVMWVEKTNISKSLKGGCL